MSENSERLYMMRLTVKAAIEWLRDGRFDRMRAGGLGADVLLGQLDIERSALTSHQPEYFEGLNFTELDHDGPPTFTTWVSLALEIHGLSTSAVEVRLIQRSPAFFDFSIEATKVMDDPIVPQGLPTIFLSEPLKYTGEELAAAVRDDSGVEISQLPDHWRTPIARVIRRLIDNDIRGLSNDGLLSPLGGEDGIELSEYLASYSATLIELPPEAWPLADRIGDGGENGVWPIVVPLWTREEGQSDLSLEAEVSDTGDTVHVFQIQVHVM